MENINFETTQNVELSSEKAGIGKRLIAIFIDLVVLIGTSIFISWLISSTKVINPSYQLILFSFIFFSYNFFFELFYEGQSIGKISQKIKVVKENGESAGFWQYLIRALLRPVDYMFALGILVMVFNKKGQRLGDIAAKTIVIQTGEKVGFEEIAMVTVDDSYIPLLSRPEAEKLSVKNIELIKQIVDEAENTNNYSLVGPLFNKVIMITDHQTELIPIDYLKRVINDYSFYN